MLTDKQNKTSVDSRSKGFEGTIFICYRLISVITNIETKEKHFKGLKIGICCRRISVTGGSVRAGFDCTPTQCAKKFLTRELENLPAWGQPAGLKGKSDQRYWHQ